MNMHPLFQKASLLTETIVAASIEVHGNWGSGSIEPVYEWSLLKELELRGLKCDCEPRVIVEYKGFTRVTRLQYGMRVQGCVLVKAKAVERVLPVEKSRLLSCMKLLDDPLGLIINFQELEVTNGISCLLLPGANH